MAGLQDLGRNTDTAVGHLTPGEMVVPPEILNAPLKKELNTAFRDQGQDPARYTVGSPQNSINPDTGYPEYFLGDAIGAVGDAVGGVAGGIGDAIGSIGGGGGLSGGYGGMIDMVSGGGGGGLLSGLGGNLMNMGLGAGLGALTGGGMQGAVMGGLGGMMGGDIGKKANLLGDMGTETLGFDLDEVLGSAMGSLLMNEMGKAATQKPQTPGIPGSVKRAQEEPAQPWDIERPGRENMNESDYYEYGFNRERGLY